MAGSRTRATMDAGLARVEAAHLVFANLRADVSRTVVRGALGLRAPAGSDALAFNRRSTTRSAGFYGLLVTP